MGALKIKKNIICLDGSIRFNYLLLSMLFVGISTNVQDDREFVLKRAQQHGIFRKTNIGNNETIITSVDGEGERVLLLYCIIYAHTIDASPAVVGMRMRATGVPRLRRPVDRLAVARRYGEPVRRSAAGISPSVQFCVPSWSRRRRCSRRRRHRRHRRRRRRFRARTSSRRAEPRVYAVFYYYHFIVNLFCDRSFTSRSNRFDFPPSRSEVYIHIQCCLTRVCATD